MYKIYTWIRCAPSGRLGKLLLIMKLITIITLSALMQVSAASFGQYLSFQRKGASLEEIFWEIHKQTGYDVLISTTKLKNSKKLDVNFKATPLKEVMDQLVLGTDLDYTIEDRNVVIKERRTESSLLDRLAARLTDIDVRGVVRDSVGRPLAGATVVLKGGKVMVRTDENGVFFIPNVPRTATLVVSYIGFATTEVKATPNIFVTLKPIVGELQEVYINKGYYQESKRLSLGSVSKVTASQIERQPVSNALMALIGQVPGLEIQQQNGLPGGDFTVKIRGTNSLSNGSSPLFIVDGVPVAAAMGFYSGQYQDINGNVFNAISPSTIESIEVLKDAEATAIYGSKGANGVILITTKKGRSGKMAVDLNLRNGLSFKAKAPKMLNTQQYLKVRRQAFKNDGVTPTVDNAPDLLSWDTTRYTNWVKELSEQRAGHTDATLNMTGGSETLQFLLSSGYHHEKASLTGDFGLNSGNVHISANQQSRDKKFQTSISVSYSTDENKSIGLTQSFLQALYKLPPNAPAMMDDNGNLLFTKGLTNPYSALRQPFVTKTNSLGANITMNYNIWDALQAKLNVGGNQVQVDVDYRIPSSSFEKGVAENMATVNHAENKTWIFEPQLLYNKQIGLLKVDGLLGATMTNESSVSSRVTGRGFSNDALLSAVSMASNINIDEDYFQYRYQGVFGRLGVNWDNKYLLNITGRRDGSSRFGPGKRFSNFGAVGAGWIFTQEKWFRNISVISFGKLRMSYGISGNDQIGDYQYMDTWSNGVLAPWMGIPVLLPNKLFNSKYAWERVRKMDMALELGFFKDRFTITANYYQNVSGNQLQSFALPAQTGFNSVTKNLDAKIQNAGWELSLVSKNFDNNTFKWSTSAFVAINRDKLLAYPGIEGTNLANKYIVGQPIGATKGYHFTGINTETGVFQFQDVDGDGKLSNPNDYVFLPQSAKKPINGGLSNNISYKGLQFDFQVSFVYGYGAHTAFPGDKPGGMQNFPEVVLNSIWQNPGDDTRLQKASATASSQVNRMYNTFSISDGKYRKGLSVRFGNTSLSYRLSELFKKSSLIRDCKIYIQAQNLFTFSSYSSKDSAIEKSTYFPPMKTLVAGLQFSF